MTAVTKAYAPSDYGQLHYRIVLPSGAQTRPPLLCLHQTPSSGAEWEIVMADLAVDRVVIAPDTPGYGASDQPPAPLLIEQFAQIMFQFMDHLTAAETITSGPFDVMGFHTGSITATEMARSAPGRVRRLVLFGLAAYDAEVRKEKLDTLYAKFPPPGDNLDHIEKLWAIFGKLSDPRMTMEKRHVAMAQCLSLGARMPWAYEAVYRYDFLAAMAEIEQDVLIINPEDDLWVPTLATSDRFRNGRRVDLPGLKHGALTFAKAQILAEIQSFLEA